jgi:hypothetical protein
LDPTPNLPRWESEHKESTDYALSQCNMKDAEKCSLCQRTVYKKIVAILQEFEDRKEMKILSAR